jgi:hypothetical protein
MRRLAGIVALAVAGALLGVACGKQHHGSVTVLPTSTPTQAATPPKVRAPGATVGFITPGIGALEHGPVRVRVRVRGFVLDGTALGKTAAAGHGHLHFTLDNGAYDRPTYSGTDGELAVKLGVEGKYSPAIFPAIVYRGLPKGVHVLEVRLANNDESDTGVGAKTTFIVN